MRAPDHDASEPDPGMTTGILLRLREGDGAAAGELFPVVYDQLHTLAGRMLRHERPDHTLQATALIHEAWLRLGDQTRLDARDRAHFVAIAARSMRQILVDHARRKRAGKRGGDWDRVDLDAALAFHEGRGLDVLALHEALDRLSRVDERKGRIVEMRFFGGLTIEEVGTALGLAPKTVEGDWYLARAWLRRELEDGNS